MTVSFQAAREYVQEGLDNGFHRVKGIFVEESLSSQAGRAYDKAYKEAPQILRDISEIAMAVLCAMPIVALVGLCYVCDVVPWLPIMPAALCAIGLLIGAKAIQASGSRAAMCGGLAGGAMGSTAFSLPFLVENRAFLKFSTQLGYGVQAAFAGGLGGALAGGLGGTAGAICGELVGRLAPVRALVGSAAALNTVVDYPFKRMFRSA